MKVKKEETERERQRRRDGDWKKEWGLSAGQCDNGECSNWINVMVKGTEFRGS